MPTCQPPNEAPAEEPDAPWDSWIEELEYKAPESELQIPAMPLLSIKADSQNNRSKLEPSWCPFPVAVTKMMSKKEMREIPEALEGMRNEVCPIVWQILDRKEPSQQSRSHCRSQKERRNITFLNGTRNHWGKRCRAPKMGPAP